MNATRDFDESLPHPGRAVLPGQVFLITKTFTPRTGTKSS